MITFQEAREIALRYIADMEIRAEEFIASQSAVRHKSEDTVLKLALLEDSTIEDEFGWVFFDESERYLKTRSIRDALAGNAPLLISRQDGTLHETGTAYPIEFYIENFKRTGDTAG